MFIFLYFLLFDKVLSQGTLTQVLFPLENVTLQTLYGTTIAESSKSMTLIIGANYESNTAGAVYINSLSGSFFKQVQRLVSPDSSDQYFGAGVAIGLNFAAVTGISWTI